MPLLPCDSEEITLWLDAVEKMGPLQFLAKENYVRDLQRLHQFLNLDYDALDPDFKIPEDTKNNIEPIASKQDNVESQVDESGSTHQNRSFAIPFMVYKPKMKGKKVVKH